MKKPICSIIAPSYRRIKRTELMIESVLNACDNNYDIEFVLRMQEDDEPTIRHIPEFLKMAPFVRCVVGLRYRGYHPDHNLFFMDAMRIADGEWCWMLSDDCTIHKSQTLVGFDSFLKHEPKDAIILPTINKLNESIYIQDKCCPAILIPTGCWSKLGVDIIRYPIDEGIFELLRTQNNWPTRFIDVEYHHHRDNDEEMEKHRAP